MSDIPSAHPTKDQICTKVLNDLSDMAKGCKSGGFKNLKSYIETVKADLESGTFPKYPFLEMASGRLYEDYTKTIGAAGFSRERARSSSGIMQSSISQFMMRRIN